MFRHSKAISNLPSSPSVVLRYNLIEDSEVSIEYLQGAYILIADGFYYLYRVQRRYGNSWRVGFKVDLEFVYLGFAWGQV